MSANLRILVVEDNPADADLIHALLAETGPVRFQIESVARLSEALARLERRGIDLVLLDLGLPDSQGLATLHQLKKAVPEIPVIVLTGTDDSELGSAAVRDGAQDYLVKGQVSGSLLAQAARYALERQRAEEVLIASELRYRRLFEAAKDGILILDAQTGKVADVNPFLIELLGFSHGAFIGKQLWELGFYKDIAENKAQFAELQEKKYVRYKDKPLKTADGRLIDVEFVSNVYQVNHHEVIQCNVRDISDRKRAEAEIRSRDAKYQSLVERAEDGIFTINVEGRFLLANSKLCQMLGYTQEECLRRNILDTYPDEIRPAGLQRLTQLRCGEALRFERPMKRKDGGTVLVEASAEWRVIST